MKAALLALTVAWLAGCARPPEVDEVVMRPCRIERGSDDVTELEYDAAGHEITRRSAFGTYKPDVRTFRYAGDRLVEYIHDGESVFAFEDDADGHHIAGTLSYRGGKAEVLWRATYQGGRLVARQDFHTVGYGSSAREVPGGRTEYTYDRYGRVIKTFTQYVVAGTETTTLEYDDSMKCRRYRNPVYLPGELPNEPCPTVRTTVDASGRRVSRPIYRDGLLMQDNDYIYSYDALGRLERMRTLHADLGAKDTVFIYSCPR